MNEAESKVLLFRPSEIQRCNSLEPDRNHLVITGIKSFGFNIITMSTITLCTRGPIRQLYSTIFRQTGAKWQRTTTSKEGLPLLGQVAHKSIGKSFTRNLHKDYRLVYEGPLSNTVKYIKTFSLATCVASLIGAPILMVYGKKSIPLAGKIAVGATVIIMGTTTTLILHWFTRVYVHRMFYNPYQKSFAVETMNLIARRRTTYFPVEHIQYPIAERAFSTFNAQGKNYFLHMELKEAELAMNYVKEKNVDEMHK